MTAANLDQAIGGAASSPVVLVACDYDGTLAEHVDDPDQAFPVRESIIALRSLAALPDTHVAVISGRAVRDLASLSRLPDEIHLVGSHGSEFEAGYVTGLDDRARTLLDGLTTELRQLATDTSGSLVERKPASVAFHYRSVDPTTVPALVDGILAGPAARTGVRVKHGKNVIELAVVDTDKGAAINRLRELVGADVVVFVGDDVTDEDGFAVMAGPDVGVKVGAGDTKAVYRVDDPEQVARMLARLYEERRARLEGDASAARQATTAAPRRSSPR